MISVKVYFKNNNILLAACDEELLGKKIEIDEVKIEIGDFYRGTVVDEKKFIPYLQSATIANLIGKKAVSIAIKAGFLDKENIILIKDIPHAQYLKMIK